MISVQIIEVLVISGCQGNNHALGYRRASQPQVCSCVQLFFFLVLSSAVRFLGIKFFRQGEGGEALSLVSFTFQLLKMNKELAYGDSSTGWLTTPNKLFLYYEQTFPQAVNNKIYIKIYVCVCMCTYIYLYFYDHSFGKWFSFSELLIKKLSFFH